jgi:hypothetical protein
MRNRKNQTLPANNASAAPLYQVGEIVHGAHGRGYVESIMGILDTCSHRRVAVQFDNGAWLESSESNMRAYCR